MTQLPAVSPPGLPKANPLAGTPLSDWVRDGAALVLLLVSLALPWGLGGDGSWEMGWQVAAGRIQVVLITILSVLSLSIGYLARFGALGGGVTLNGVLIARMLMNAPYALLVVVYLVLDAAGVGGSGLGPAAAFGLAGALLAAQPREFEVGTQPHGVPIARIWFGVVGGAAALIGIASIVGLIRVTILLPDAITYGYGASVAIWIVLAAVRSGVSILLFLFVLRRSEVTRTLGLGIGGVALAALLIAQWSNGVLYAGTGVESFRSVGYLHLWLGLAAGLFASPGVRLAMRPIAPLDRWLQTVARGLQVLAIGAAVWAVIGIIDLIGGTAPVGVLIGQILCLVIVIVGVLIARAQSAAHPVAVRPLLLGVLGGTAGLGIVIVVLAGISSQASMSPLGGAPVDALILFVGLPLFLIACVLVPEPVRRHYGDLAGLGVAAGGVAYPGVAHPGVATVSPDHRAPVRATLAQAHPLDATVLASGTRTPTVDARSLAWASLFDPATPAERLAQIAAAYPEFGSQIAQHPHAYPELVAWIAQSTGARGPSS